MAIEGPAIVVAAHGDLAGALVRTTQMIAGEEDDLAAVSLVAGERPQDLADKLESALAAYPPERPILLLVDLFGGTPANVAAQLLAAHANLEVVTGVNLPMLLEVVLTREGRDSQSLAASSTESGRNGIVHVREHLRAQGLVP